MIISFDPGVSTGVVAANNVDYQLRTFDIAFHAIVLYPNRATIQSILATCADLLEAVVIENFRLFPNKAASQSYSEFEPVKVIERITVYCEQLGLAHLIKIQEPAQRKSATGITEEHQKVLGRNPHLYAAYQHLRYYVFMQKYKIHAKDNII